MAWATALWIAAGGAVGSLARYAVSEWINRGSHPWGTVTVNIAGSFLLGVLLGIWGLDLNAEHRIGLTVGLLGGFTTFSTFALDSIKLWEQGEPGVATLTVFVSVAAGLAAGLIGLVAGRVVSG